MRGRGRGRGRCRGRGRSRAAPSPPAKRRRVEEPEEEVVVAGEEEEEEVETCETDGDGSSSDEMRTVAAMGSAPLLGTTVDEEDFSPPSTSGRGRGGRKQGRGRGGNSCHQCKRVKPRPEEMVRCQLCGDKVFCAACIKNKYHIHLFSPICS